MSDYPQPPLPFFGASFVPPPAPAQFVLSPRNSPHPWRNYSRNAFANNAGIVGPLAGPQLQPVSCYCIGSYFYHILICGRAQQGNGYEANAPAHQRGLSAILKNILSNRISHPDSEVVAFRTETIGNGKTRVTVAFETFGEM